MHSYRQPLKTEAWSGDTKAAQVPDTVMIVCVGWLSHL